MHSKVVAWARLVTGPMMPVEVMHRPPMPSGSCRPTVDRGLSMSWRTTCLPERANERDKRRGNSITIECISPGRENGRVLTSYRSHGSIHGVRGWMDSGFWPHAETKQARTCGQAPILDPIFASLPCAPRASRLNAAWPDQDETPSGFLDGQGN